MVIYTLKNPVAALAFHQGFYQVKTSKRKLFARVKIKLISNRKLLYFNNENGQL